MNYTQLTENERYQIYVMKKAGHRQKVIATLLGRNASTISRELCRNQGLRGYRPGQAQRLSDARRQEAHKASKVTDEVRRWIETLLRQELSPQQVVDYLQRHKQLSLHHETVYQLIYEEKATGGNSSNYDVRVVVNDQTNRTAYARTQVVQATPRINGVRLR